MSDASTYYQREGITIHHGDCLEVLPRLPSESIDFVLTDPPYLVGYQGRWDGTRKVIVGDEDPSWLRPAFADIYRLMKPDTLCVSFYGWPHVDSFLGIWKEIGFRPVSHLAFVKRQWGLGRFTRSDPVRTLVVFDEIDANVGGRLGDVLGQKLAALGTSHQVLCVTHLPQVASYAADHWTIRKQTTGKRTSTSITRLATKAERVEELALMLRGEARSETTRKEAAEMLAAAKGK